MQKSFQGLSSNITSGYLEQPQGKINTQHQSLKVAKLGSKPEVKAGCKISYPCTLIFISKVSQCNNQNRRALVPWELVIPTAAVGKACSWAGDSSTQQLSPQPSPYPNPNFHPLSHSLLQSLDALFPHLSCRWDYGPQPSPGSHHMSHQILALDQNVGFVRTQAESRGRTRLISQKTGSGWRSKGFACGWRGCLGFFPPLVEAELPHSLLHGGSSPEQQEGLNLVHQVFLLMLSSIN